MPSVDLLYDFTLYSMVRVTLGYILGYDFHISSVLYQNLRMIQNETLSNILTLSIKF